MYYTDYSRTYDNLKPLLETFKAQTPPRLIRGHRIPQGQEGQLVAQAKSETGGVVVIVTHSTKIKGVLRGLHVEQEFVDAIDEDADDNLIEIRLKDGKLHSTKELSYPS